MARPLQRILWIDAPRSKTRHAVLGGNRKHGLCGKPTSEAGTSHLAFSRCSPCAGIAAKLIQARVATEEQP